MENSEGSSKLTILAARQEHCGCYTLLVENKLGSRQAQVNLTVVGESGTGWPGSGETGTVESTQAGRWTSGLISQGPSPSDPPSAHSLPYSHFLSFCLSSHCCCVSHVLRAPDPTHTLTVVSSSCESLPSFSSLLPFEDPELLQVFSYRHL